ncbi:MAG TPA: amino acid adenylation domain-containing protein, partial [Thermoanaerobaculia bacterium]|nr:amino acid adenylation domain-containing protein [Thermoanaerobaculia bacterium]
RHAGQDDVLVGSPIAGRNRREVEELIGFFINTLVLRTDLSGNPPFVEVLRRVRSAALGAYAHQDLPFEQIVDALVAERDLSHTPLFQVLFSLQNTPTSDMRLSGLTLEPVHVESGLAKFDLSLTLGEGPDGFGGGLEHNTDLFDRSTAARFVARFETLLAAAVADPEQRIADLPLLLPAERQQLLEWGGTAGAPSSETLHGRFAARVRENPRAVAVVCGGESLTYGELDHRANQFALRLRGLGAGPDERIGLCAERSLDLIVGLVGILKSGAAYVPLDPRYPAERLATTLEDAGVRLLVGTEEAVAGLPAVAELVLLDRDAAPSEEDLGPIPEDDGASLAYVIYTSGSTGRPKGSLLTHGHVVRLFDATHAWFGFDATDVWTLFHSHAFDFSVWEIWGALLYGGRLVVVPYLVSRSPEDFHSLLASEGVTVLNQTPSAFAQLERVEEEPGRAGALRDLRWVIFGGEALDPQSLAPWIDRYGDEKPRLVNMYGITETTVHVTYRPLTREDVQGRRSVVGEPIPDLAVSVLDPWLRPAPIGVPGELVVAGAGLARGYLGRPDLTAERFIPDPVSGLPGERIYRSGDLARYLPDGDLEYLGRIDHQVKIRGFRIELGEIEAVLRSRPEVRECVVVVREDVPGDRRLVAYLVGGADPAELRGFLAARLPEHMVPAAFVALDSLPLTPNGKVDRKALPAPERRVDEAAYVAPGDALEEQLAAIWREVLRLDRIGVQESFFAAGGHSLLATQVATRVRQELGIEMPLRWIFEAPTIAQLAERLRQARPATDRSLAPIVPAPLDGDLPLSFAQQRLWFLDQLEPGSGAYNIPLAVRLSGELPVALLEQVFAEVVRRHAVLRTVFASRDAGPVQVILPEAAPQLPVIDLSDLSDLADRSDLLVREIALAEAVRPFDLARGPLLRLALVRLAAREHVLLLTLHHIVSDGWSMGVLLREIAALCAAFGQGRPSPLPGLPVQYADFAVWQRDWLQGEVLEAQLAFWKERLAGAPRLLELPTDRPRPAVQTYNGAALPVALAPTLSEAVRALCQDEGATPFMTLLAAWAVLLGRHASQEDVLVGSPIAGRNRREIEELIGFFVNTLVLRSDLSDAPSFRALLTRVRTTALDAYAHQDLPFERIVEAVVLERDLSHPPLFQVLFTLQNAPAGELRIPGLVLAPVEVESRVAKFDLSLALAEGGDGFGGSLEHNTDLFDPATAERFAARFAALLEGAVADPDRSIADLPLLLPAEAQQLLEWKRTGPAPEAALCLHELFATQAARTPEAVALVHGSERWTYARLAWRAGGLARRLREIGVGGGTRVAVCLERSPDLIAALLGVLAAGSAYVPIDPAYPRDRRTFMVKDSRAEVLVTRGRLAGGEGLRVLDLDAVEIPDAELPAGVPVTPSHLAYVIYTSGSTGRPKGVAIEHRSAVSLALWARGEFSSEELSGVLAATSVCFDLSVFEIFVPLSFGGTVFLAENALELPHLPAAAEVRLLNTVPSAASELVRSGALPASVRTVCLAGEPLPGALVDRLYATGTVERVLNLYGPSEDTTYSTGSRVPPGEPVPAIGRPLPGTRAHVVDRRGTPVPPGVAGELWLAGAGLARGYLGRPELTAERFVPDPFGGAGERAYRTGDLVRFRSGGELEFLGRIDHQVKLRGFRIELGEIETLLASHPGVRECVVVVREDVPGSRLLVAYVVGEIADLRGFLGARLPEYMVPSLFVVLEALPRSPNGKVDRRALPVPERAQGPQHLGPRDGLELALAEIWEEVLGVRPVGVRDDFFALGGHSLLAVQVTSQIRKRLGRSVPLATLLRHSTVERLAAVLRDGSAPLRRTALVELAAGSGRPLFLVHPVGGEVLSNVHLARRLARPVYGLQVPDEEEPRRTVEEMAAAYVHALREIQPSGPYTLGGWSMGGVVAFEMARQLESRGEAVDAVVLIDSFAPGATGLSEPLTGGALVAAFALDLAGLLGIEIGGLPPELLTLEEDEALRRIAALAESSGLLPPGLDAADLTRRFATFAANHQALGRYTGGPGASRLILLRAAARPAGMPPIDPDHGWGAFAAKPVEVHELPGDHYTLLREPVVADLAALLAGSLEPSMNDRLGANQELHADPSAARHA